MTTTVIVIIVVVITNSINTIRKPVKNEPFVKCKAKYMQIYIKDWN